MAQSKLLDNALLAQKIIEAAGGAANIADVTHCATRLRLTLKTTPPTAKDAVSALPGVLSVIESAGQFQVVIGTHVADVYDAALEVLRPEDLSAAGGAPQKNLFNIFVGAMTSCLTPFIYIMAGCGMLQGLLVIATKLAPAFAGTGSYAVLNFISWTPFAFLPVFIVVAGAQHFKVNQWTALLCGCALVNPSWAALAERIKGGEAMNFLVFPLSGSTYTFSILPPILLLALLVFVERFFNKILPEVMQPIFAPLLSALVMVPLTLCAMGPITSAIGDILSKGYTFLYGLAPAVCAAVTGFFFQIMVIFGVHWSLTPMAIADFNMRGYSAYQAFIGYSICTQVAASFAVFLKTKNRALKQTAISAGITGLFSITEPAIYGVNLRLKKPFFCACAASAVASVVGTFFHAYYYTFAGLCGFLSIPNAADPTGGNPTSLLGCAVATAVGCVVAFVLVLVVGFDDIPEKK